MEPGKERRHYRVGPDERRERGLIGGTRPELIFEYGFQTGSSFFFLKSSLLMLKNFEIN
jgi:hypothetical protein